MNKLAIAAVTISATFFLSVPPVLGYLAEQQIRQHADRIEALDGSPYNLEVIDYAGGWFGSTARVETNLAGEYIEQIVAVATSDDDDTTAAITGMVITSFLSRSMPLVIEIGHGPIMFSDGPQIGILSTVIRLDPEAQGLPELLELLGTPYLFEIRTLTAMSGSSRFSADVPPIELDYPFGEITFSGLDIEGNFDFLSRQVDSVAGIEFLRVDAPGAGSLAGEDILLTADVTGFAPRLWLGDILTEVGSVAVESSGPNGPFNLDMTRAGARFDSTVDESGELITIEGSYYLDSLSGDALASNSSLDLATIDLADASFDIAFRDFAIEALQEYYAYSRLVAIDPRSAPPLFPGVQDMLYLTLATSPTIEIGPVEFRWDDEPFAASVRIDVDGSGLPERDAFNMFDRRALFAAISVDAYADLSELIALTIAAQASKSQLRSGAVAAGNELSEEELDIMAEKQAIVMLLGLVSQGLVEASDVGYHSDLQFVNGELTVNGTVLPIGLPL